MDVVIAGPAKNALGTEVLQSLRGQIRAAGDEPLLVRGEGDVFSAGLNLKELVAADPADFGPFFELLNDVFVGLFRHPAPTVACVAGHAIAGGAVLARACDHAVATTATNCRIGLNETALGVELPPRALAIIGRRLPVRFHSEVVLGARLYDPVEAQERGLVDELAEDTEAVARARLDALAEHPRAGYAANKAILQGDVGLPNPAAEARFLERALPTWTSPELKARVAALFAR